jgi:DNA invertase Pin-like site-specific DNA recombinase
MKDDIEKGKINMILTRDLSRFARNYVTAGYYLEDYFKENGIRFISALDNVDTLEEVNDIVPFKNILNEMYIKDCSRRTRDGLKQRMVRGSSIASKPPYGYQFEKINDGNVKTIKLVPANDETTEIVKEIFNLYIDGWGSGRIATYLNSRGIAPPSSRIKNFGKSKFGIWTNNTIICILTNPKYAGFMVQGRWKKVSYKIKKVKTTPKEEWIYGDEFQGIISKETFDEVQRLMKKRARNYRQKGGVIHLFSGVLMCKECGGSMSYRNKYQGYKCTNSQMGGGRCTAHSVKENDLKSIIIEDLKKYINKVETNPLFNEAEKLAKKKNDYEKELLKIDKELSKLDIQFENLYMDKLDDTITTRNFESLSKSIQKKQDELIKRKESLEEKQRVGEDVGGIFKRYKEKIRSVLNFEEFDRTIVESLIDKVIVTEDVKRKYKEIDIYYKFEK